MSAYGPRTYAHASSIELASPINIPPRPALLIALQHEMAQKEPHISKVAHLINRDVAIAGNLFGLANSAFFNLRHKAKTVEETIVLIGLKQCSAIVIALLTKRTLAHGKMMMPRFWDVSEKRSWGMAHLARKLRGMPIDSAHNFGLFCDIGIPLMIAAFPDYLETLQLANKMEGGGFTQLENRRHKINHALVGAMLTEFWQIDPDVTLAVRNHHAIQLLENETLSSTCRRLLAAHFVVEKAIQEYRDEITDEWNIAGITAMDVLNLSTGDVEDFCIELKQQFGRRRHS